MRAVVLTSVVVLVLVLMLSSSGPEARPFVYPNGRLVYVTRETTERNPYTWTADGRAYESSSIEYVYSKLEERARARGSARLLDVGAQSGLYALYARHFDGVVVDAYEPFPESYACLVDNIALNGVGDKVRAFAVALSDAEETRAMRYTPEHTGAQHARRHAGPVQRRQRDTGRDAHDRRRLRRHAGRRDQGRHRGLGVLHSARRPRGAPPRPPRAAPRGQRREHAAVRRHARRAPRAPRRARVRARRDHRRREHGVLRALNHDGKQFFNARGSMETKTHDTRLVSTIVAIFAVLSKRKRERAEVETLVAIFTAAQLYRSLP
jgi:hypothetical protein